MKPKEEFSRVFRPSKSKVLLAVSFFITWIAGSALAYFQGSLGLAISLFFPARLYQGLYSLLRAPGFQDVMHGKCYVPHCNLLAVVFTLTLTFAFFYSTAAIPLRLYSVRKGN